MTSTTETTTPTTIPPCPSWCTRTHDPDEIARDGALYHSADPVQIQLGSEPLLLSSVTDRVSGAPDTTVISIGDREWAPKTAILAAGELWDAVTNLADRAGDALPPCPPWCTPSHAPMRLSEQNPPHRSAVDVINLERGIEERCQVSDPVKVFVWQSDLDEVTRPLIELELACDSSGSMNTEWLTPAEARAVAAALISAADKIDEGNGLDGDAK